MNIHMDIRLNSLQRNAFIFIKQFCEEYKIKDIEYNYIEAEGVRGYYYGVLNLIFYIHVLVKNVEIDFYFSYDQLEAHFTIDKRKYASCNIEDFGTDEEVLKTFKYCFREKLKSCGL